MATQGKAARAAADEAVIRCIPHAMIDAWNHGDAQAFAAPFADDAAFVAFEGTELNGRDAIAAFHRQLFDTAVKGTRLANGEVRFVRFLGPDTAVMHARCGVVLAGQHRPTPSRESMQLFVCQRRNGAWRVAAVMNARRLTLEQQQFADEFESLAPSDRHAVRTHVSELAGPPSALPS